MSDLTVKHRPYINVSVSKVFQLLTSDEGWTKWFTYRARIEPRPGGALRLEWVDFGPDHATLSDGGHVVEIIPDRLLSFTWHPGTHETLVTINFEPRGPGCILNLEESGYRFDEGDVEVALNVAAGWGEALTLLKFYLESGLTYGPVPRS